MRCQTSDESLHGDACQGRHFRVVHVCRDARMAQGLVHQLVRKREGGGEGVEKMKVRRMKREGVTRQEEGGGGGGNESKKKETGRG